MRIHSILIAVIALLPLACKKEIKEIETPPTAVTSICYGNSWKFDNFFIGHSQYVPGLSTVYTMPIVYDDKVYVFDPGLDEIFVYDGTNWKIINSQIPFDDVVNMGFTLGNKGYLMPLGNELYQYNFPNNTWAKKADFPGLSREGYTAGIFTIGTKGYIVGGSLWGEYYNDTWEYSQASNTWKQKADFSPVNMYDVTSFSIGDKGYLVNGVIVWPSIAASYSNQLLEYDPVTNVWTRKADFPGNPRAGAKAFVIGGSAYVGGGYSDTNPHYKGFYKYAQSTNSWSKIADIPITSYPYFSFAIHSKGYVAFYSDTNEEPSGQQFIYKYTPRYCVTPEENINAGTMELQ